MPESLNLYLDQMLRIDVAQALRDEGHDVVRTSKSGKPDQMIRRYYKKRLMKIEFSSPWMSILVIGLSYRLVNIQV